MRNLLLIAIVLIGGSGNLYGSENINVVTESLRPFNYVENGVVKGIASDIVKAVLDEAEIDYNIHVYPWPRAYDRARHEENVLIYTINRTRERESHFKWIGQVALTVESYLYKLKGRKDIAPVSFKDLANYRIGVPPGSPARPYLLSMGISEENIVGIHSSDQLSFVKMLTSGRIDLWAATAKAFSYSVNKAGYSEDFFEKSLPLEPLIPYLAASLKTSDGLVQKIIAAHSRLLERGEIELQ